MADISKIKLANGTTVDLKDAAGRADFATLLGDNTLAALKSAAWKAAQATWDASTDVKKAELPTVGAVKSYVDAQIEAIPTFECVVCPAQADQIPAGAVYYDASTTPVTEITGTMAASATTYKKIYLVKNDKAQAGAYLEYITVRSGDEGSYTYTWEQIGSTVIDLSNYVTKTTQIAGLQIGTGIEKDDLQTALELGNLAYKDQVKGSTTLNTIDSITMDNVTVAGNAAVTTTETAATLTKAAYTPSGSILVDGKAQSGEGAVQAIKGGSIAVTLKDESANATITYEAYTPAGSVAAIEGGDFTALKTATFEEVADETTGAVQVAGTVSKPAISLTSASQDVLTSVKTAGTVPTFSEGAFTAASLADGFYTKGTAPSKAADTFTAGSFTKGTAVKAATEGVVASIGTGEEAEVLIFTAAATDDVMDHDATFVAPTFTEGAFSAGAVTELDLTKFNGGSKAADTFTAGAMPTFNDGSVNNVSAAALDNAPVFTGKYYKNAITSDTALKTVAFTGTSADIKAKTVAYDKQAVDAATFTPVAATISFSGSKVDDALVTAVKYDKADATAAFSETVTPTVKTLTQTAKTIEITSNPI